VSDQNVSPSGEGHDVELWEPRRVLRRVNAADAAFSCGFLRCRPEKWFPGFSNHWLPVLHALGCDARINEIKPTMAKPPLGDFSFVGSISGERVVLSIDNEGARGLSEELVPGAGETASRIVVEYFFRRLLASLVLSWSGPESATVSFEPEADASAVMVEGAIKISFVMNTASFTMWVGLGKKALGMLDGLWRRQVHSMSKVGASDGVVRLELSQLGVPPQMLSEYLSKGTVIDLEIAATESITVKIGNKPWMPARLVDVGGNFGCEMTPGALAVPPVAEGATQLSVEFGSIELSGAKIAELGQAGAILVSEIPVSGTVNLIINQEKVGVARLCVYEGRFAIEVQ
jgi:flagellar motor switch/type III secretory pathway protein FliN